MAVEANRIATLAKDADTPRTVGPVLLIANVKSDGSTEVLRFVTDESIVDMVLEQLGKDGANDNASDPAGDALLNLEHSLIQVDAVPHTLDSGPSHVRTPKL